MSDFTRAWECAAREIHQTAVDKGWWETDRNDYEMISLMHAELSEAVESLRTGNPMSDHLATAVFNPPLSGVEEEFADVIIRIMDTCYRRGWRVADAIEAKMTYNQQRSYRHGGKLV